MNGPVAAVRPMTGTAQDLAARAAVLAVTVAVWDDRGTDASPGKEACVRAGQKALDAVDGMLADLHELRWELLNSLGLASGALAGGNQEWDCAGCGLPMVGARPADSRCRSCGPADGGGPSD